MVRQTQTTHATLCRTERDRQRCHRCIGIRIESHCQVHSNCIHTQTLSSCLYHENPLFLTYQITFTVGLLHFIMGKLSCHKHKKITIITEESYSYNHIISLRCTHRSTILNDKTFKIRRSVQISIWHIYA